MTTRGRGRPPSKETLRMRKAMEALEKVERGELVPKESATVAPDSGGFSMDVLLSGLEARFKDTLEQRANQVLYNLKQHVDKTAEELKQHERRVIDVKSPTRLHTIDAITHNRFEDLISLVGQRIPTLMVGPAGSGKTFSAELTAHALGLPFYAISVGSQTSKSDLIGYMNANGNYVSTQFRQAYENGGVFLMDEIDAGNANVLVTLNSALAGSFCAFSDQMIRRHEDFVFVATANTYGNGADRQYVGRNQLDAATLDRFAVLTWPVDELLEWSLVESLKFGDRWCKTVQAVRKAVEQHKFRLVVSPRATIRGAQLLEAGVKVAKVIDMTLLSQCDSSQDAILRPVAREAWGSV